MMVFLQKTSARDLAQTMYMKEGDCFCEEEPNHMSSGSFLQRCLYREPTMVLLWTEMRPPAKFIS